ncbi:MAG: TonB-dependent receptor [Pseudomonadota bacterium]
MKNIAKGGLTLAVLVWPGLATAQVFDLGEIVVLPLATPTEEGRTGATVEVLDANDLAQGGTVIASEQLAQLPGVNLTRSGGPGAFADFQIRGARSRYVSVFVDGILVTDPSAPTIQYDDFGGLVTGTTQRVELLKGSQSALYGGTAVGGVVDVTTLGGFELGEGTHQSAAVEAGSFGTYGGSYSVTRNTGDLSLSFGASHVTSDGFSAADENDGNTEADGFTRTRYAAQGIYQVSDTLTLGANAFVEDGRTEFDEFTVTDGATPGDDVSFRDAFGARAFVTYENGSYRNETTLSFYGINRDSVGTNAFGDSSFSARGERIQISNISSFAASQAVDLSIGIDYLNERSVAGGLPADGESTSTTGGFVEAVYSPTDRTDIIATARIDSHSAFGEFLTGRLAFAHRPDGQTTYRGAIATGYRAPSISELFADFGTFTGNPDLVPETSVTAELGVDRALAGGGQVSATVFWGQIDNLIQTTADFSTVENVAGASIRQGIELSGEMPINGGATIYGAATFMEARSADGTPLARVPTTDIVIGGTLDLSNRVTVNGNARYVAGLFDAGAYLPSFTVVNAGADYALSDTATAYVRIENLLGTEYQTVTGYGTSDLAIFAGLRAQF